MHWSRHLLIFLIFLSLHQAGNTDELLPAEQAFAFDARLDGNQVRVRWTIADGYYLYRDKIQIEFDGEVRQVGALELPPGETIKDSILTGQAADLAVFKHRLDFSIPVEYQAGSRFTLIARGQGCNQPVGVCYPPITYRVSLPPELPAEPGFSPVPGEATGQGRLNPLASADQLRALLSAGLPPADFLEVDDAFSLSIDSITGNRLTAAFHITPGYYLYRDKIAFESHGAVRITPLTLPPGEQKTDPNFGPTRVFRHDFRLPLTLIRPHPGATQMQLTARYQGCAEDRICYAPVQQTFTLALPELISSASAAESPGPNSAAAAIRLFKPTRQTPAAWLFAGALLAGIALAFTPCVLPMIPILSSVIAGQGANLSKRRGGLLAAIYVAGTAATYAAMGAIAGATGEQLQAYFQTPWAIGILCAILVLMALSLFGLFRLQMPARVQTLIARRSRDLRGTAPLVFLLGLASALIVGACVSPVLISFLSIAMLKGDAILGATLMLLLALGMGLPLVLFGLGAGHFLPRGGQWSERVNRVFGVLLIGVALYLLQALPAVPVGLLWGGFLILVGVYMGATTRLAEQADGWQRLNKGVATLLLIWGTVMLIGGFFGQRDLFRPLPPGLFSGNSISVAPVDATAPLLTRISNIAELNRQLDRGRRENRYVLIDFYADWCTDCVAMEETTFRHPLVREKIRRQFIALQIDLTDPNDADGKALKRRLGVFGPPAMLFFDRRGTPLTEQNFYGYRDADALLALLASL